MKKIALILCLFVFSFVSVCSAQSSCPEVAATAKQFGYYAAFGDATKASLSVTPETDITVYVNGIKSEIDQLGGLDKIIVGDEESINGNESKVTVTYVCKKEGASIQKTYTLIKTDSSWKIAMDKL